MFSPRSTTYRRVGELRDVVVDLGLGEQDRMPAPGDLGESVGD